MWTISEFLFHGHLMYNANVQFFTIDLNLMNERCKVFECENKARRYFYANPGVSRQQTEALASHGVMARCHDHSAYYQIKNRELTDDEIEIFKVMTG